MNSAKILCILIISITGICLKIKTKQNKIEKKKKTKLNKWSQGAGKWFRFTQIFGKVMLI